MRIFIERGIDFGRSFMTRLKHWSWWAWLIVFVVGGSIWAALANGYANWVTGLLSWLWNSVSLASTKPMGVGGLVLLIGIAAYVVLLLGLSFVETSPVVDTLLVRLNRRPSPAFATALQEAAALADDRVAKAQSEAESIAASCREQVLGLQSKLAESQRDSRQRIEILQYGSSLMEMSSLDAQQAAQLAIRFHELGPAVIDLRSATDVLWLALRADACGQAEDSPISWLGANVMTYEAKYAIKSLIKLNESINGEHDARPILARAYVSYCEWRNIAFRLAAMLGKGLAGYQGYDAWRKAEVRFAEELGRILTIPALVGVKETVRETNERYGSLADPAHYPPQHIDAKAPLPRLMLSDPSSAALPSPESAS